MNVLIRNGQSIPFELPSSDDEVKNLADHILDNPNIAGPIYHSVNKRLACIYLKEQQDELAIFHLAESHGCSLRHQAIYRYDKMRWNENSTNEEKALGRNLYEIVALDGQYTLDKYQGLQNRLTELPSEWTIVQLTVQYDPMLRITQKPTQKHNPIHLTRMSCGSLANKTSIDRQGGPTVSVLLSPSSNCSDVLDIVTTLIEADESHKLARSKMANSNIYNQFGSKLQSLIKEFEQLLKDTNCILPGNLMDTELHKTICSKVDKIVEDLAGPKEITQTQLQVLYLLATSPDILNSKESEVLNIVLKDSRLANKLYKAVSKLHKEYQDLLSTSARYPVIMILDELLDMFPIEMVNVLKNHPVSRVPSVHFAHALYREHSFTIFRSGIKSENGYYIVNPSGDLKECERKLRTFLTSVVPKWDGIFGIPPTDSQFLEALAEKAIFLYCGHGGGNQYAATSDVERVRTQAVSFLMGCSSIKIVPLGGRVDGFSIFNSFIIGGCPCVVGMLWDVTDVDANRMTEYMLKRWLKPIPIASSKSQSLDDVSTCLGSLSIQEEETGEPDLLRLLPPARLQANHVRNSAALVVRGLPVKINWS